MIASLIKKDYHSWIERRRQTVKKWGKILLLVLVVLLLVQLYFLKGTRGEALRDDSLKTNITYQDVPTLLVPGWGGNAWTYSKFIKEAQQENIAQKMMTIHVTPLGKVKVKGTVKDKKNALIQVIFDWNYTSGYNSQTKWLRQVLTVLHDKYHVDKINIVGHSWGGSAIVHAIAGSKKLQQEMSFPKVVLLGTPLDESINEEVSYAKAVKLDSQDENYRVLKEQFKAFSPTTKISFYNVMGSIKGEKTDGSVPNVQSMVLKELLDPKWAKYYQVTYNNTDHTALHQSNKVLNTVDQILWSKQVITLKK